MGKRDVVGLSLSVLLATVLLCLLIPSIYALGASLFLSELIILLFLMALLLLGALFYSQQGRWVFLILAVFSVINAFFLLSQSTSTLFLHLALVFGLLLFCIQCLGIIVRSRRKRKRHEQVYPYDSLSSSQHVAQGDTNYNVVLSSSSEK